MLAGLAGLLRWQLLGGASGAGILLFGLLPGGRRELTELAGLAQDLVAALRSFWVSLPLWLRLLTLFGLLVSALRFFLLIWILPPFVWDSLTYHLTNVAHWVQAGRIELFHTPMERILTPANYEVLAAWFTVFLSHDVFVEAAGLPAYALAVAAVYAVARQLDISRPGSWLAALAYGTTPAFLIAVTGTKNDPHMAAYYLLSLALLLFLARGRSRAREAETGAGLVLLALVLLLAAGTKAYIAHLLPGLLLAGLLYARPRDDRGGLKAAVDRNLRGLRSVMEKEALLLGILLALGLFLGGYWNIRNWILEGNPFYPYGVAVEGRLVLEGADRTAQLTVHRLTANLELLWQRFGDRLDPIRPDLPYATGWGWFAYSLGLPALIWGWLRERRARVFSIGFIGSFSVLLLSIRPTPWNLRYAIWLPAMFALGYAMWFDRLRGGGRWLRTAFGALIVVTLGLNVAMTLNYNRVTIEEFGYMLEQSVWSRTAANLRLTVPAEYEFALRFVPRDELLGYSTHSNGFIYPLYRADFSQRLVYVPFQPEDSCEMIAGEMRERGTRYLLVAPEHTPDRMIARLRECAAEGEFIRERARGLYILGQE